MKVTHSLETLSPKSADSRRRELQSCFEYLLEREGGPLDQDPAMFDFIYEERCLGKDNVEIAQILDGSVAGNTLEGLVEYTTKPLLPDDDKPPTKCAIVYSPEAIVYDQWQEDQEGNPASGRHEVIMRSLDQPSYIEEWKITGM